LKEPALGGRRGFTLMELLVALVVLTTGLFALVGLLNTATRQNRTSQNLTTAVVLAEQKLEVFKNTPFTSLSLVTDQADPGNPLNGAGLQGGIFNRYWTIKNYSPNVYQVTLTISWTDQLGSRSYSFDTLIAK
jgi:type IV pilus assembly protein PilV